MLPESVNLTLPEESLISHKKFIWQSQSYKLFKAVYSNLQ